MAHSNVWARMISDREHSKQPTNDGLVPSRILTKDVQAKGLPSPLRPDSAMLLGDSEDESKQEASAGRPGSADSGLSSKNESQGSEPLDAALIAKVACTPQELTVGAAVERAADADRVVDATGYWRTPETCRSCYERDANNLCKECVEHFCVHCAETHAVQFAQQNHQVQKERIFMPYIGGGPYSSAHVTITLGENMDIELKAPKHMPKCDDHEEQMRFICLDCNQLICQDCSFLCHRHHNTPSIECYVYAGVKYFTELAVQTDICKSQIRRLIDRVLVSAHHLDRETTEAIQRLHKESIPNLVTFARNAVVQIGICAPTGLIEARNLICDIMDRYRYHRYLRLHEQLEQLRTALAELAESTEGVRKILQLVYSADYIELIHAAIDIENHIRYYTALSARLAIVPNDVTDYLTILESRQELAIECGVSYLLSTNANEIKQWILSKPPPKINANAHHNGPGRRAIRSTHNNAVVSSEQHGKFHAYQQSLLPPLKGHGMCIPNSIGPIALKPRMLSSHGFGRDGSHSGQLSRPWGICVDRMGNIIVGDRRNNRIQVFNTSGTVLYKFGEKGSGDGQLELPAGITTDRRDRIIVADKDNHRVQVFTADGKFVLKFGGFGKAPGEFQYPWDVATNSSGNIAVTDTRNHRVQLFDENGAYLKEFAFETHYMDKTPKGHITPRGVCFDPEGAIYVTDFENHRIMKLDRNMSRVVLQVFV